MRFCSALLSALLSITPVLSAPEAHAGPLLREAPWGHELSQRIGDTMLQVVPSEEGAIAGSPDGRLGYRWTAAGWEILSISEASGRPEPLWSLLVPWASAERADIDLRCRPGDRHDILGNCLREMVRDLGYGEERWFSDHDGLHVEWTLVRPPPGGLLPILAGPGARVEAGTLRFGTPDGGELRWTGLAAVDAQGRRVPVAFEAGGEGAQIRVDARGAAWPIRVDPILEQATWVGQGDELPSITGQGSPGGGPQYALVRDATGNGFPEIAVALPGAPADPLSAGMLAVFDFTATGPDLNPLVAAIGGQEWAFLGTDLAAGDPNCDGIEDVVTLEGVGNQATVRSILADGLGGFGADTWSTPADPSEAANFFQTTERDLTGDGCADLIVMDGYQPAPALLLFAGSAQGLSANEVWRYQAGGETHWGSGFAPVTAGDWNGDGWQDLVLNCAACNFRNDYPLNGWYGPTELRVFMGGAGGLPVDPVVAMVFDYDEYPGFFVFEARHAGPGRGVSDITGDGVDDLFVSMDSGELSAPESNIRILTFDAMGVASIWASWLFPAATSGTGAYGVIGDVDGDGTDEIATGNGFYRNPEVSEGLVQIRPAGGPNMPPVHWQFEPNCAASSAQPLLPAMDLDGDGLDDIVVASNTRPSATLPCIEPLRFFLGQPRDDDGDGSPIWEDCDDNDTTRHPGVQEFCDVIDQDCDGDAWPTGDQDQDGLYDCQDDDADGDGVAVDALPPDCDDLDPELRPGAEDPCDGIDQDCDGRDGRDDDGDGYTQCTGDCDDGDPAIAPGAHDDGCDGLDVDCDGDEEADEDGDGVRECAGDCDDHDATVFPGAAEGPDGQDHNCDGQVTLRESDVAEACGACDDNGGASGAAAVALIVGSLRRRRQD